MSYSRRQLRCIELGLCLDCNERSAGAYRRCMRCRARRQADTPLKRQRARLKSHWVAYVTLKRRGVIA